MTAENKGHYIAVEHLISLEKEVPQHYRYSAYHKTIIEAIGEAGNYNVVEHLISLEKEMPQQYRYSEYHKAIIEAIGKAGRIL